MHNLKKYFEFVIVMTKYRIRKENEKDIFSLEAISTNQRTKYLDFKTTLTKI